MRAVSNHTRLRPSQRVERLINFNRRMHNTAASLAEMERWQLCLSKDLVQLNGRKLPQQEIVFGNDRKQRTDTRCDWSSSFRDNSFFQPVPLKCWYIVFPRYTAREVDGFLEALRKAAQGMRFDLNTPKK